jgi:hypothetical protein
MTGKKKEDGIDDSIGGFKTRSYKDSELITNQEIHQFTAKEKKEKKI